MPDSSKRSERHWQPAVLIRPASRSPGCWRKSMPSRPRNRRPRGLPTSSATAGSSGSSERAVSRHSAHRSSRMVYPLTLPGGIHSRWATRFAAFPRRSGGHHGAADRPVRKIGGAIVTNAQECPAKIVRQVKVPNPASVGAAPAPSTPIDSLGVDTPPHGLPPGTGAGRSESRPTLAPWKRGKRPGNGALPGPLRRSRPWSEVGDGARRLAFTAGRFRVRD